MTFLSPLVIISLLLLATPTIFAEPSAPSCEIALKKIDTARKALLPFRRILELARAHEHRANGEVEACIGEDHWKMDKPLRCRRIQWQAPPPTKGDLAAVDQYRQDKRAFEDLFAQAKQMCLLEP